MEDLEQNNIPSCLHKDRSRARLAGGVFEFQLAGLVALRLRALRRHRPEINLRYSLATNVDGANPFDDIVLHLQWMENGRCRDLTYFVQLKHKENTEMPVTENEITGQLSHRNKDFNLHHYYAKFKEAVAEVSQTPDKKFTLNKNFLQKCFTGDFRLVLLTTKEVYPKQKRSQSPLDFPFEKLFSTEQGEMFSFGVLDDKIWNMMNNDPSDDFQTEFLPRLRIFSAQSQVKDFEQLMVKAMTKALGRRFPRTEHLLARYVAYVQKWWERNTGDCLTQETCELEEVIREDFHKKLEVLSFQDRYYNELRNQLNKYDATYIVIPGISDNFRCSRIKSVLENRKYGEYTILTEKSFRECSNFVIESLCSSKISKEIVLCVSSLNGDRQKIIENILSRKQCVRILSSKWHQSIINFLARNTTSWNSWTERWMLYDLSRNEQRKLLSKNVYFQGQETTLMALYEFWPTLCRSIHGATFQALITGKTLSLGDKLTPLDPLYIERTVEHVENQQNIISFDPEEFLLYVRRSSSNTDYEGQFEIHHRVRSIWNLRILQGRFFVSEFPKYLLNEMRSLKSFWEECNSSWIPLHKTRRTSWPVIDTELKTKWTIWEDDSPSAEMLYERNVKLCWLRYEGGRIVCEILIGEINDLQIKYKKTRKCKTERVCSHNDISELRQWDGVCFLASDPGIGKTTFLVRMLHTLKERFPLEWVLLVRIGHGTLMDDVWKDVQFKKDEHVEEEVLVKDIVTLLTRVACSQEMTRFATRRFIEDCLKRSGNISILLDGVDEVCPSQKQKALRLLELLLQETRFKRLWVAARPVIEEDLSRTLHCTPLRLRPFSPQQQRQYILRHWAGERLEETDRQMEDYVDRLLLTVRVATERDEITLCDIPLYMKMLAEAYRRDYIISKGVHRPFLYVNFTRLQIMNKFLEETRKVYWAKIDISTSKIVNQIWYKSTQEIFLRHHKACAMNLLFSESVLDSWDKSIMEEIRKIITVLQMEKTGIIVKIIDGKPVFVHRIFAEYFAALWLSENYTLLPKSVEFLYDGVHEQVRDFFDAILSEGNPLHEATGIASLRPLLSVLNDVNIDIEKEDKGGRRALHLAAINGQEGAVIELLDKGADMRVIDKVLGWTPLRYSAMIMIIRVQYQGMYLNRMELTGRHMAVTEVFLQRGMNHNDLPKFSIPTKVLKYAIQNDFPLVSEIIIRDRQIHSSQNSSPEEYMHKAAELDSVNVMAMLLRMGFSVNELDKEGSTPLHRAASFFRESACKLLIENGADVNCQDSVGNTPLHIVRIPPQHRRRIPGYPREVMIELLLDQGADPHIKNLLGQQAIDMG